MNIFKRIKHAVQDFFEQVYWAFFAGPEDL
jgi:hypothetical protein